MSRQESSSRRRADAGPLESADDARMRLLLDRGCVHRFGHRFRVAAALVLACFSGGFLWGQQPASPMPPKLSFVYEEQVTLGTGIPFGETPVGKRNIIPITGGTFSGPGIQGKIVPGGWDWQLASPGGCFSLHADYMIQTDDAVMIHVVNQGTVCANSRGEKDAMLTTPVFEAPKGKYDWLNGGVYVGTLETMMLEGKPAVRIRFFKAGAR